MARLSLQSAPVLRPGHQIELLQGGRDFFPALIAAIDGSVREVKLETYIFHLDASGQQVAEALMHAALRSVQVTVVVDGVGTSALPADWEQRLKQAGVQWHRFSPLGRLGLLIPGRWRRLHRKLCVVDGAVAFCGGINILDDLQDPGLGTLAFARFDFALRITGPLVSDIHQAMTQFWGRLMATQRLERMQLEGVRLALHDASTSTAPVLNASACDPALRTDMRAALLLRDNVLNRSRIERAYRKAIAEAQQEVLIANAYFLPGGKLRRALIHAARRGVRVRLLLQGRYEYFMQFHASRPVYGALLDAGVEIHEYQSGFLHAKVAVIDSRWATVGSSNLDPLSLLLAREANVVVDDAPFAQALRTQVLAAMQEHGVLLDPQTAAMRPWRQRFLDGLAYGIMRLMLYVTGKRY